MLHSIQKFLICLIRGSLCLLPCDLLHFRQEITKLTVVDIHTVVQVEADPLVGEVTQLLVKTHCPRGRPLVLQVSV